MEEHGDGCASDTSAIPNVKTDFTFRVETNLFVWRMRRRPAERLFRLGFGLKASSFLILELQKAVRAFSGSHGAC